MSSITCCCSHQRLLVILSFFVVVLLVYSGATTSTTTSKVREASFEDQYVRISKARFEDKFQAKCLQYKFVHHYFHLLQHPSDKFFISVYEEGKSMGGGLGDRLAGIITGFAYALRTNRTFLLEGGDAFTTYFRPFDLSALHRWNHTSLRGKKYHTIPNMTWSDWRWAGWNNTSWNRMKDMKCVNPKNGVCTLDRADHPDLQDASVLKYRGNRCFLCRWVTLKWMRLVPVLRDTLGFDNSTNLYEVAGCMLRLALYPTPRLWQDVGKLAKNIQQHEAKVSTTTANASATTSSPKVKMNSHMKQIGIHFRCGDVNFKHHKDSFAHRCTVVPGKPWKGIKFEDDLSHESPIDLAKCAASVSRNHTKGSSVVYVASDNNRSAHQILQHQHWHKILRPHESCHVDLHHSVSCGLSTLQQWFMLAMSDTIVTQSFITNNASITMDKIGVRMNYQDPFPKEQFPTSAFSRFAGMYGLSEFRYGQSCGRSINMTTLSHYTHGNWFCDPVLFF